MKFSRKDHDTLYVVKITISFITICNAPRFYLAIEKEGVLIEGNRRVRLTVVKIR